LHVACAIVKVQLPETTQLKNMPILFDSLGPVAALGIGLVFGLKHATEADHIVAVSTIVSDHRNLWRSALVGAWWGIGHTASLLAIGLIVLIVGVAIPAEVAPWLEFAVALMVIALGISAVARALRKRRDFHLHRHTHDGVSHVHIHFHDDANKHEGPVAAHSHTISAMGKKPLLVGAMHGLAGSAALTLLVMTRIQSPVLGLLYLAVFGLGSVTGMLLMSGLIGLPFVFASRRLSGIDHRLQILVGACGILFGIWYVYQSGLVGGLWRNMS
jgi:ABC-type nickel/cobalt efflux system permease component RcnA